MGTFLRICLRGRFVSPVTQRWVGSLLVLGLVASAGLASWVLAQGGTIQVGYGVLTASPGNTLPVASALFSFRNSQNVLVAEAGVGAVAPIREGRIYVDETSTATGLALVNPSNASVTLDLSLRNEQGEETNTTVITLAPNQHTAQLVRGPGQLFPNLAPSFTGSLTFRTRSASQRVGALTIRQSVNSRGEPLLATLPVADLEAAATALSNPEGAAGRVVFPHLGAGEPLSTQIILINPGSSRLTGRIRLIASDGNPLSVLVDNTRVSTIPFDLAPDGTFQALLTNGTTVVQGYAVVELDSGNQLPVGTAIFQFREGGGRLISEAGVSAILPTTAARIFVDTINTQTGVAVASPDGPANLTIDLLDKNGLLISSQSMAIPANGHFSAFAGALFPDLPSGFTGLMEIRSATPVAPITLKLTGLILTTLPIADLTRPPVATMLIFPQLGFGGGFSTRLILINTQTASMSRFTLSFTQTGDTPRPLSVPLLGATDSSFDLELLAGAGRQLRPGNTATVAQIIVDPDSSGLEIPVNSGGMVVVRPVAIDSRGELRDDFEFTLSSLDTSVATVDGLGRVNGKQAGFSTLTLRAGGQVQTAVIVVSSVSQGAAAFQISGLAGDLAGRIYMTETNRHRVLRSESLGSAPAGYAGVSDNSGLRNGERTQALFNSPSQLTLDQASGTLYVADRANHVIRKVEPGANGGVETFAGTGQPGSRDGDRSQATFSSPEGLLLDDRGFLWVADTGNHTIRRINLETGQVVTVAGRAGSPGNADGNGSAVRFNSPMGMALESEPLDVKTARERRGDPPPPVRIIVADSGNNRIRRVEESGRVETLSSGATAVNARWKSLVLGKGAAPETFSSPASVAVDSIGNIYVSEPGNNRVRLILQNGPVVPAGQEGTFDHPQGLFVAGTGRLLVADFGGAGRQLEYAPPLITSLSPAQVNSLGGGNLVIRGRNFSPDAFVVVAGTIISNPRFEATNRISVTLPNSLPSGLQTVSVQTRGGLDQAALRINPVPLADLNTGEITTIAGGTTFVGDGNRSTAATLNRPVTAVVDSKGNLFIADTLNNRIRRIDRVSGVITTVAGTGIRGFSGDNGPAVAAGLDLPESVAVDRRGNIYVADTNNHRIRRIDATTGQIATIAGNGLFGEASDGMMALEAPLVGPERIAVDAQGDVYFADSAAILQVSSNRVFKVEAASGRLRLVAGNGQAAFSGDGGPATQASLNFPAALALDPDNNLYIADTDNHAVRRVGPTGQITTVAGRGGMPGFSGDGGAATNARLQSPADIALDGQGNLYIADLDNFRIRRVDTDGRISTIAGNGSTTFSGDGGLATQAGLAGPTAVAVDGAGNVFINEFLSNRIRIVNAVSGRISTYAGTGASGTLGDGGPAAVAALGFPGAVEEDAGGNLYIADQLGGRIRRVDANTGEITTVAGNGSFGFSGDGGPATSAALFTPGDMTVDASGNIYIADTFNNVIRRVDAATGRISTIAGTGAAIEDCTVGLFNGDGPALAVHLAEPSNVALDLSGNLLIADTCNNRIRRMDLSTGMIATIAGNGCDVFRDATCQLGDQGLATQASLGQPHEMTVDSSGNIIFADQATSRVRRIDPSGIITTIAGNGCNLLEVVLTLLAGNQGLCALQDGAATQVALPQPSGVAVDGGGNVFVSDFFSVRRVDAGTGDMTNAAGNRCLFNSCALGDGGQATQASLFFPTGLEITAGGDLLIADSNNLRIRAVREVAQPPATVQTLFFDNVDAGGTNWIASAAMGPSTWARFGGTGLNGSTAWFGEEVAVVSDQRLALNGSIPLPADAQVIGLFFWHAFNMETTEDQLQAFDGGVLELSVDGGPWFDANGLFASNGYNLALANTDNPLPEGTPVFSGTTNGFYFQTAVDLTRFAGSSIRFRFRLVTDSSIRVDGWYIDDILLQAIR